MNFLNTEGQLMPYISIIIPIHNGEKYLHQCIDSALNQTFTDIEVICVDDCSTDNSASIVENYSKEDKRIRLLCHEKNMGTLKARSAGVEAATGQYIMFLDQDDEYEANACEVMYHTAKKHKADIYGFGTEVINSDDKIRKVKQEYAKKYVGHLYGADIIRKSIIDAEFTFEVWNKMFASDPCKKAHEHIGDYHVGYKKSPFGEDFLAFIAVAYFSESFFGIEEHLYRCHYGRGFLGRKKYYLEDFERHCMVAISVENCREFFTKQGNFDKYKEVVDALGSMFMEHCINIFLEKISKYEKAEAMQLMMKYWPHDKLAMRLGLLGYNAHASMNKMKTKSWEVPFKLLPKGGKIVLYGAGDAGQDYYRQLTDTEYCEVVLWVDRNYETISKSGMDVKSPDEIAGAEYDYILIAVLNEVVASSIKQYLMESFDISGDRIIMINRMSLVT